MGNHGLVEGHLNLRLVRLASPDQWAKKGDGFYFLFCLAGAGQFANGSTKQPLSAGDLLILNGDPKAVVTSAKGSEFAFSGFSLRLEHLLPLFGCAEISLLQSVLERFKGYKYYPASTPLASECQQLVSSVPPQFNLDHRGHLLRLAAAVLNTEFKNLQTQRAGYVRVEDHLIQVFESLSADDMLTLSVHQLADRFGCSRRHLNRLFHQYLGFSVAALRMEMRLLRAVSLLRNSDAKVINVAEQCGFNHLGLFNTCFRRRFGTSPGQWRKQSAEAMESCPAPNGAVAQDCPLRAKGLFPSPADPKIRPSPANSCTPRRGRAPARQLKKNTQPGPTQRFTPAVSVDVAAAQKVARSIAIQIREKL